MEKKASPRVPGHRILPAAKNIWVDTSEGSEIFRALSDGGCKLSPDDLRMTLRLPSQIEWVLRDYLSDQAHAMAPASFRDDLRKFRKSLSSSAESFPRRASVLDETVSLTVS